MRSLVVILLVGLCATAVAAPPARKIVVILPPTDDPVDADTADLALVMQTRAAELLTRTHGFDDVHLKQIMRVLRLEGLARATLTDDGAALVMRRFGAERAIHSTLSRSPRSFNLTASVTPAGRARPLHAKLSATPARAVEDGALILAQLAAGTTLKPNAAPTTSDEAILAYAHCYATIIQQPLAIDTPLVIDQTQLARAVASCQQAVAADPQFQAARAALGLALALSGKDEDAVRELATVQEGDGYLPLYWVARYWLVTRYQSVDAGAIGLKKAIEKHPYFLLAYGYLAEHDSALHHDEAALADWRAYLAELPHSAAVHDGDSHSLARLGRHDEAVAEARAATQADPDDREATLELGSRELDAGHGPAAIAILLPLAQASGARAEAMLRLGYAYALAGDTPNADKWLRAAEEATTRPEDWRTRARARLDRGVMLVKNGQVAQGQELLVAAERGGLRRYIESQKDGQLRQMVEDAEAAQREKQVGEFQIAVPQEVSPFELDGAGEIAPAQVKPTAPKMFEVLRF